MLNIHNYRDIVFPKDFVWGSATAAHQIEGEDIYSINWRDQSEGRCIQPSGKACNSYHLYKEDVELLKKLGHQAYRFSIPWSRIEPEEGKFSHEAMDHYVDLLRLLKEADIKTFVTVSHGSDPAWFWDKGGFSSRDALHYFERYVDFIVPKLEANVDFWMTINEINIMERIGCDPIELRKNYLIAHAKAFRIIKHYSSKAVGVPHAMACIMPSEPHFEADHALAALEDWTGNGFFYHALRTGELVHPQTDAEFVPELKDSCDFWAINYYTRKIVSSRTKDKTAAPLTYDKLKLIDKEFYISSFWPEGLYTELMRLKDKPIYITENGTCCTDDRWRIVKICQDLSAIQDAMNNGADVRGYLHWSLMDNYEWISFVPRFGLVHVDFETFKRTPKQSAWFYKEIITQRGFTAAMVEKYLPELPKFSLYK